MGLLNDLATRAESFDPVHPRDPGLVSLFGLDGGAGAPVTPRSALRSATFFGCLKVIGETLGCSPLHTYEKAASAAESRQLVSEHPIYQLLRYRPNALLTAADFWEMAGVIVNLRGNFVSYKKLRNEGDYAEELLPLHPDRLRYVVYQGKLAYRYQPLSGAELVFLPSEVLHLRGMTLDGYVGLNPLEVHRELLGSDLDAASFGRQAQVNAARPGGILQMEGHFKDEQEKEAFKKAFHEATTGANAAKTALLERGIEWKQMSINHVDLEYMESRKMTREMICGVMRVPPHMVGDLGHATYSNIEHQSIDFIRYCMLPWYTKIEQAVKRDLLLADRDASVYVEFLPEALLRGDVKTRHEVYARGRQWGYMSANDVLRKENEPTIGKQGDQYLVPVNMRPADQPYTAPAANAPPKDPNPDDPGAQDPPEPKEKKPAK